MANEEHLAILRQCVATWNASRKEHTDLPIHAWSDMDLIHAVDHDLRGNAARVWSTGQTMAQDEHGCSSDEQRHLLEQIRPHLDRMMDAEYHLTLWIDAQDSDALTIVCPIQNVEEVLSWTPRDLLRHVDHDMQQSLPVVRQIVHDLTTGHAGFISADQKDRLRRLHRDVERLRAVVEVIHVWLNAASSAA